MRALEGGGRVVVGTVREPRAIDAHGFSAELLVSQVIRGDAAPERTRIAWEELARSRQARFAEGDRVLVVLEPLPPDSLWRTRFPAGDARVVASRGDAFLHDPDEPTVRALEAWARAGTSERESASGVALLATIFAAAPPTVAGGALARLADVPGLDGRIHGEGAERLAAGIKDASRPRALRADALRLVAARRLGALRPAAEALAKRGDPLEAPALDALAALSGGLPSEQVQVLLSRPETDVRAVGARHARGELLARVRPMVTADAAAEVRAAAALSLLDAEGLGAFEAASPALFDADPSVRAVVAQRVGAFGEPAVVPLRALVEGRGMPEAGYVIGTLVLTGDAGRAAVLEIERTHPDPKVREVARLARGQLGGAH